MPTSTQTQSPTPTQATAQVYQVYIKATPEAIWEAITTPEWSRRYGYRSPSEFELRPGGAYRALASAEMQASGLEAETIIDGEVVEIDPPRKLVQTWRTLWNPEMRAEGFTRLTWETAPAGEGVTRLTVTHELAGAPLTAAAVGGANPEAGGGWPWILSDLKSLLETGSALPG